MTDAWIDDGWIVVHDWDDHNPGHTRRYGWIKVHKRILHEPKYLDLTLGERGVLLALWILTAELGLGNVPSNSKTLARLAQVQRHGDARHFRGHLISLNHAGWIAVETCDEHADRMSRRRGREGPNPLSLSNTPSASARASTRTAGAARAPLATDENGHRPEWRAHQERLRDLVHTNRGVVLEGIAAGHYDRDSLALIDDHTWNQLHAEATHDPDDQPL